MKTPAGALITNMAGVCLLLIYSLTVDNNRSMVVSKIKFNTKRGVNLVMQIAL
jgi:hypothetical protein